MLIGVIAKRVVMMMCYTSSGTRGGGNNNWTTMVATILLVHARDIDSDDCDGEPMIVEEMTTMATTNVGGRSKSRW